MHSGKLKPWFFGTILLFLVISTHIVDSSTQETKLPNSHPKITSKGKINDETENPSHSRQKRLLWITSDGRLALPPGTTLVVTPSLSLPFVRYPPDGFFSNLTISLPFTIDFNKLGLTDNENPYGVLPPIFARSMGRAAGNMLGEYVMKMLESATSTSFSNNGGSGTSESGNSRRKRSAETPSLSEKQKDMFHGGERALLYVAAQEFIQNFGLDGKACLLRAICEVQAHPMSNFGLFGEMLKLFLTASKSPYSTLMKEYVDAEEAGSGKSGPAECWPYLKDCPKSLFVQNHNKYSKNQEIDPQDGAESAILNNEVTYDPNNISE